MVDKRIIKAKTTIEEIFFTRKIELDKIVLFGSFARGEESDSSDIDILIISKSFRRKSFDKRLEMTKGLSKKLIENTDIPFDVLYYSDEEWNDSNSVSVTEAKKEGKLIYP